MLKVLVRRLPVMRALQSRSFTLLLIGQTISALGDMVFDIALTWEVLLLTRSAAALGIVLTAESIPRLLFLLVGGAAADRLPRRLVLLFSDSGRAVVVLLISLLDWLHLLQFWQLIVLALFFGFVDGFFSPAYRALLPQLVDVESIASANALRVLGVRQSRVLGSLLGAGLITLAGPISAFTFDGLTFVISALCLLMVHNPEEHKFQTEQRRKPTAKEQGRVRKLFTIVLSYREIHGLATDVYRDIQEGLSYVMSVTWLWVMILTSAVGYIIIDAPLSLAVPRLVLGTYKLGVSVYGEFRTASAVGAIIGIFLIGQLPHPRRRAVLAILALIISGGALFAFGLPLPRAIVPFVGIGASLLVGFGLGVFQVLWATLLQELVPGEKLGRVNSIDDLGTYSLFPLGYLIVGILIDAIGTAWIFISCCLISVTLSGLALCVRSVRQLN